MKNYLTGEMHAGSTGRGTPDLWSQCVNSKSRQSHWKGLS